MDWKNKFENELALGGAALARGNQGQARVCARRAAGPVLREYFQRQGMLVRSQSAYDLLNQLLSLPSLPAPARQAAEYLTMRVTDEFELPVQVDLLLEARRLAESLLPGE